MNKCAASIVLVSLLGGCSETSPYGGRLAASGPAQTLDAQYQRTLQTSSYRAVLPAEAGSTTVVGMSRQGRSILVIRVGPSPVIEIGAIGSRFRCEKFTLQTEFIGFFNETL